MNTPSVKVKPSRIDLAHIDVNTIAQIVATGDMSRLSPAEAEYYSLMDLVRGLRARVRFADGQVVTRAAIIKILQTQYGIKPAHAYRIYNDAVNFFYQDTGVTVDAYRNMYAERMEKAAYAAEALGDLELFHKMLNSAAKLRGCFEKQENTIPEEMINPAQTIIYTTKREDLGLPEIDRKELRELLDKTITEIPDSVRERVKQDAGLAKFELRRRMIEDQADFGVDN